MTPEGIAPPEPEACLARPYPSSQKGGTIVVGEVIDLETHKRLLANPDGYRPSSCPGVRRAEPAPARVFAERKPKGEGMPPVLTIAVFMCARCTATWRVLPGFSCLGTCGIRGRWWVRGRRRSRRRSIPIRSSLRNVRSSGGTVGWLREPSSSCCCLRSRSGPVCNALRSRWGPRRRGANWSRHSAS